MKKHYKVIGAFMGLARGSIFEADEDSVVQSGLLGSKLEEVVGLPAAQAPETPVHADTVDPKGNGGPTTNTSSTAPATPAPTVKPAVVAPVVKPATPNAASVNQPAGVVAKPAVAPVSKPAVEPK